MPITFSSLPAEVAATLSSTLPRFAASQSIEARLPAVARFANRFTEGDRGARSADDLEAGDPLATPIYVLGLDDLVAGRVRDGARLALWATIVPSEAGVVSAEVQAQTARFAQVTNGASVVDLHARVVELARAVDLGDVDRELTQLRIPALHLTLIWLRSASGDDVYVPIGTAPAPLRAGRRYSAKQLSDLLGATAQQRIDSDLEG